MFLDSLFLFLINCDKRKKDNTNFLKNKVNGKRKSPANSETRGSVS